MMGAVSLICILGWSLGSSFGQLLVRSERAKAASDWQRALATEVDGIGVGRAFPSFPVWSTQDSRQAVDVRAIIPNGGILIAAVPSCQACTEVVRAFRQAANQSPSVACPLALVVEGEASDAFVSEVRSQFAGLQVYLDVEQTLLRAHNVTHNPTYYVLDSLGVVRYAGHGLRESDEFLLLMKTFCPCGERQWDEGR
jgi:hypothetical protein